MLGLHVVRCPTCFRRLPSGAPCPTHPKALAPAAETIDEEPPEIEGYADYSLLGFGGFSRVWQATMAATRRKVAVKVSLAHQDPRFDREADAMRRLGPSLCPELIAEGRTGSGNRYITMELLQGRPLSAWLAHCPVQNPPIHEASALLSKLCALVDRMHEKDVLHRDLKPENTMLLEDGSMRVLDLGLARYLSDEADNTEVDDIVLTQAGSMLGTVTYIAPEQSLGRKNLNERADLYSLSVMAFELVTGRTPFVGTHSSIVQAHSWQKPPLASELAPVSSEVDEVLIRGLAKDPAARWETATELAEALTSSIATMAPQERSVETSKKSSRQLMALLSVRGAVPVAVAQKAAARVGGQMASTSSDGLVIVFASASTLELGLDAAVGLAHELGGQAECCVVHVAKLRARASARGVIVMGDAVKDSETWSASYTAGIHASPEAASLLSPDQLAGGEQGKSELRSSISSDMPTNTGTVVDWGKYSIQIQAWGRDELIRDIESEARSCFDSRSAMLTTVIGDVGLGKTHLAAYLRKQVREWKRVRLIALRAGADGEDRGDALLRRLVREAFGLYGTKIIVEDVEQACAGLLGDEDAVEAWPVVARALHVIDEAEFDKASSLVGPTAARQALARAISKALCVSAEAMPIALLIDDANRADFTTLDALELATLAEVQVPLWVLAIAGPQLDELRPNWGARARVPKLHVLRPLPQEAARGLLMQLLYPVEFIPDTVVASLVEMTLGVPLYLEEVATALKHNGAVRVREGTESFFIAADELVAASKSPIGERLARSALGGMREDLALFAQLCAIVGQGISEEFIDAIQRELDASLGFSSLDPGAGLRHLLERRMLRRASRGHYEFRNPMMRDAVEGLVPLALRRVLHAATYRSFEVDTASPLVVARHAEKCGENRVAAEKYMQVATDAEGRFRYVESQQAYTSVLVNLVAEESEMRMQALTGRSRINYCVGRHDDALFDLSSAMEVAQAHKDEKAQAEMLLEQATILDWMFQYSESAKAGEKASEVARRLDDAHLQNRCALAVARSTFREGKNAESIKQLYVVEEEANRLEDYATHVIAMAVLGGALAVQGNIDEAEECLNGMIELSRRVGDRFHLAVGHANRMLVWGSRHDYPRAIEDARQAVNVATEIGAFPIIWVSQHALAELLMWLGRCDEALGVAVEARDIQHRCSNEPDPADTLLIARVKIANDSIGSGVHDELAYLHSQYEQSELSPLHKIQTRMVELWQEDGDASGWKVLLAQAEESMEPDERLELLLAYARAAKRGGRTDDVTHAITLAHEVAGCDSVWLPHFDSLKS